MFLWATGLSQQKAKCETAGSEGEEKKDRLWTELQERLQSSL